MNKTLQLRPETSSRSLSRLAESFRYHLKASNLSPATLVVYTSAVADFDAFAAEHGLPQEVRAVEADHIKSYLAWVLDRNAPATAATKHRGLRAFFRWAEADGELTENPMLRVKPPRVPEQPVPIVSD